MLYYSVKLMDFRNSSQRWSLGSSRVAMTLVLSMVLQSASAYASPLGGNIVAGQASISGDAGGNVTVTQTTDRAVINWDSFSIANNETVVFRQPGAQSITANRVLGADPSRILGSIQANGRVILINRNGVVFGKDANVDAAGLVVSTHELDQSAFMAGGNNLRFSNGGIDTAEIVVNGRISIRDAGLAAFVAPHVRNDGLIEAKLGRVALGAGRGFSVDLFGDGLINFAAGDEVTRSIYGADGSAVSALVENSGTIIANGGQILLTASAARDIINASVNVSGVVRADSASNRNGTITLSGPGAVLADTSSLISASGAQGGNIIMQGGAVALGGIVDVSSSGRRSTGGSVNVEAQGLLSLGGTVKASSAQGVGGSVVYRAGRVMENSSGVTDVRGLSDGGAISAIAARNYATSGKYLADGLFGKGGRIDITGSGTVSLLSANLSASGRNMGGLVRVGGPFQGGKAFDGTAAIYDTFLARWNDVPALPNATNLFVNDTTRIDASAAHGTGGTAILWSDKTTTFLGAIDVRGWTPGSTEVSSASNLRYVSLEAINTGPGGTILLDPKNIIVGTNSDVGAWSYAGVLNLAGSVAGQPIGSPLATNDLFGTAVSLNAAGDRLAVGASGDDGFANDVSASGAVYLFSFSDTNFSGGALQTIIGSGYTGGKNMHLSTLEADDTFGTAVSLNAAGDRLAVGASGDDGFANNVSASGLVYVFSASSMSLLNFAFADYPSDTINISAASLSASLRSGSNVVLQASNDITVNNAILVTTGVGSVGTLNLNAGRSILINANIATQGGNVVLIGNSTAASGVVDVQRDPGAAAITMAPGTSIDAGTGSISVLIDTGAGLTNSTSGDISLGNLTGSAITVRNAGPTASSGIILNNGAQLSASGSGNAITLVGQKFVNNTGATALSAANGFWRIWSNNPSNDTVGGLALDYKQYGLSYAQSAVPAGIGNGLIYSFAPTLSATLGASSKPYDTDRIATPASLAFSGVLSGDVLTLPTWTSALYNTKDVGANKTVTVTGLGATITSGGKPVYGYVLPSSVSNTSSSITPASLVIAGVAAQNKVYDGTLNATLTGGSVTALGSDVVSLVTTGATGSFATKDVGNGKAVTANGYTLTGTDAGNYTLVQPTGLTANITAASVAVTGVAIVIGVTAQNKVYDGTLNATLTGGSVTGVGSDAVSLVTTGATGRFATKDVGIGKAVTASGYALTGADAGNYTLVQPTGLTANITPVTNTVWHYLERDKPERGCNQSHQQGEHALSCTAPWVDWSQVRNSKRMLLATNNIMEEPK